MTDRKPYIATDTTEPSDSVGVGDALAQEEEPTVPAHGAAGVAVGAYIGAIARRVLWRYAWWLALPVAVAFGGLYDWRYAVIALMLLLLVFPMVVTIAVFNHGMHPAVVRRTRTETVELTSSPAAAPSGMCLTSRSRQPNPQRARRQRPHHHHLRPQSRRHPHPPILRPPRRFSAPPPCINP